MILVALILGSLGQSMPASRGSPPPRAIRLLAHGADHAPGLLVNHTVGVPPFAAPDPGRLTIVIVHGINPYHPFMHIEMAQRYGEAIGAAWGRNVNVMGWDWNADTMRGPFPARNAALAEAQGKALGEALLRTNIAPEAMHLVGQSSGCIVAVSAARWIAERGGRTVNRLTLLDPRTGHHPLVFGTLQAGAAAGTVNHVWAVGPSGFGASAPYPGVNDHAFVGPAGWRGFLSPENLDHMHVIRWHISRIAANPWSPR